MAITLPGSRRLRLAAARRDVVLWLGTLCGLFAPWVDPRDAASDPEGLADMTEVLGADLSRGGLSIMKKHGIVSAPLYPTVQQVAVLGRDAQINVERAASPEETSAILAQVAQRLRHLAVALDAHQ